MRHEMLTQRALFAISRGPADVMCHADLEQQRPPAHLD